MNDFESKRYQMLGRVRSFCAARTADFPTGSLFAQLLTSLTAIIARIEAHLATQSSGKGTAREGSKSRGAARNDLRELMEAIRDTARAIAVHTPGLSDKFRVPPENNDQKLLAAARGFLVMLPALAAEFTAREMPANFIDDLNERINNLQNAIDRQASAVGDHVGAHAALDEAIDEGMVVVRSLHPIIKNKYANDAATLAEWTSASHTESSAKHKPSPPPAKPPDTAS